MGKIHLLPGSTDSSPTARGSYQSENEAKLTLAELNEWLYLEIAGQYHHDIHRMIGTTPAAAWAKSLARGTVPALPSDPARFVIGFLPIVHRKLQRNGLFFERIRYWADVLLRNSRDVGPRFHGMSVQHFTRCRPGISRHVGPGFHGMSVQFVR
jgi:putative transposase